jgi:membrane protease YdiL (CAAX protease family)
VDDPIPRPAERSPRQSLPRRHPLTCYVLIAFVFSWLLEIPLVLVAQGIVDVEIPRVALTFVLAAATFGPTVAAFVTTGLTEGKGGVRRLGRRYLQWRAGLRWYAFVLIGIPLIIVAGTVVVPGAAAAYQPDLGSLLLGYPVAFAITLVLGGPLGEEPGWRGFALPLLQERHGPLLGSLILGVVWALWHLPLFWTGVWTPPSVANITMFTVMIVALTIIMTWVFNHVGGSILLLILMHASFNTFANAVAAPLFPAPILEEYGLLPVLIGFTATAIVLVIVTRGRLGIEASVTSPRPEDRGSATPRTARPLPRR